MPNILTESEILEEDLIESRVGVHDSNHFEVKLDYAIPAQGKARYQIDYYFFVPASLGLNKHSYSQEQFYGDVQAYIRFKTPNRPIVTLTGKESPIRQMQALIASIRAKPTNDKIEALGHELRMFGCIVRANVRDRVRSFRERIATEIDTVTESKSTSNNQLLREDCANICSSLAGDVKECVEIWRTLRPDFIDGRLPETCNDTFAFVDEYLSLVIELNMTSMTRSIDKLEGSPGPMLTEARKLCTELLLSERTYRGEAGYATSMIEDENDHFVYRQGLLKKFVTSILWLDLSREKDGRKLANFGAAIAAGLAMLFALLATIYASEKFTINSMNFVVAGVVTYIMKDRIKDWGKSFFGARFSRFVSDYNIDIHDPISGENIGRCRETFGIRKVRDVPTDVVSCRKHDSKSSVEDQAKPEVILHYAKEVKLRGKELIERMHLEDYNINDIVRFSLNRFLPRADDPTSSIPYYVAETDTVERRNFRKVYHLNIVMVMSVHGTKRKTLKRVRVLFDKNRIIELQHVINA